jgi:Xaa-Pro aminopeptidase
MSQKTPCAQCANPFAARLAAFQTRLKKRRLDAAVVRDQANVRALTGIDCDNAVLLVTPQSVLFHTDFRYIPMVHRTAPWLKVKDIKKVVFKASRIGYESNMSVARFDALKKQHRKAAFVDILKEIQALRAVKTADEVEKLRAAVRLNDEIWAEAQRRVKPGMTEKAMARIIKTLMIERGDGEAFETIVCVGANAAECHHVPDDTVWDGKAPVLVDMGVKLDGYCSDMTRNIVPAGVGKRYRDVYAAVKGANEAAIAAAKPGMTAEALDKVARDYLAKRKLGKAFGHSLGHGVGVEIHEAPWIAKKQKTVLKAGMVHSIEPGAYLENDLGVRIEDLVLITADGCELLSQSAK